jgi:hypothetical protein
VSSSRLGRFPGRRILGDVHRGREHARADVDALALRIATEDVDVWRPRGREQLAPAHQLEARASEHRPVPHRNEQEGHAGGHRLRRVPVLVFHHVVRADAEQVQIQARVDGAMTHATITVEGSHPYVLLHDASSGVAGEGRSSTDWTSTMRTRRR